MKCEICCVNDALGVAASRCGPMSLPMCRECIDAHAEPEWTFEYLFSDVGENGEGLAEWVALLSTFKDGRYVSWADWKAWRLTQPAAERSDE